MKQLVNISIVFLILISCESEPINETFENQVDGIETRNQKIDICHYSDDTDTWVLINVSENAWPAFKKKNAIRLDDQDGDGYVPYNTCGFEGENGMGDCDDENAAINPGASEIFGNGIDDDCNPDTPDSEIDVLKIIHRVNGGKPDAWDDNIIANDNNLENWEGVIIDMNNSILELSLVSTDLTVLPPEIGLLSNLRSFDLRNNELSTLPLQLFQLTEVQFLNLFSNQIAALPLEIENLTNLLSLNLSSNLITILPAQLGKLTKLHTLSISSNQLSSVPPEIGLLAQIRFVDLSRNEIIEFPPEVGLLSGLQDLYLNENRLETLSREIGQLESLLFLDIGGNPLITIPKEVCALSPNTTILKDPEDVCETP